jgi:uncharacterized membrane protein
VAKKRSRLTLQVAFLSESRVAEIIGVLDELRLSAPAPPLTPDAEATARPRDHAATMQRIEASDQ